MPDNTTKHEGPAADQVTPEDAPQAQADPLLEQVRTRLPEDYELIGPLIHQIRSAGRTKPLCGPVLVRSQARGADGTGWSLDVIFQTFDGGWQNAVLPMRDLLKAPARVVAGLVDRGFDLRGKPGEVCDLLRAMEVDRVSLAVGVTGWVGTGFERFILPSGEIVTGSENSDAAGVLFTGAPRVTSRPMAKADRALSAAQWVEGVIGRKPDNAVMLGLCAAIAPVLMPVRAEESWSFLLHLHGNDGAGRLSRAVAASVWGQPTELHLTWSEPQSRLLAAIRGARDGLVLISGYEPRHHRKIPAIAEALAGIDAAGPGRVVVLSTGMVPLLGGDGKALPGQDLRNIIDIDCRSWEVDDPERVLAVAAQHAGSVGPEVLRASIDWGLATHAHSSYLGIKTEEIKKTITGREDLPLDAETDRVALACGAMYGAGHLATLRMSRALAGREHLLQKRLKIFCVNLLESWVAKHRGLLSAQDRALLSRAATAIRDLLRDEALVSLDAPEGTVPLSDIGWFDDSFVYLTSPTVAGIAREAEADLGRLFDLLQVQDLLKPGGERGYQYKLPSRVPGRPRAYRISRDVLRFAAAG
ncbi:hypothetical protein MCRY_18495 [Marivita cryptomonadis]|uniref:DUF927 domain-containing protein n=1 Tax=Marivita cryptomonadis TaxID=505252 RepID=UPI000A1D8C5F|nr:DUF927 domain-containing protein [Marivita cryptomonadis]OSQ57043.1 hypothetical protein MCRY_18495 [Marivita cryptomonadis]